MENTIQDASFEKVQKSPLPKMIKVATTSIATINQVFKTPKWRLSVPNPKMPRLYGLPKVHKPGNKMRPIVSNIDSPTYKIAKWLVSEFNKLKTPNGLYVKNTYDFVDRIKDLHLQKDEVLVSFDVISLYPNIPIPEALQTIDEWLDSCDISDEKAATYSNLTKMCMEQNAFIFNKNIYKLTHGTSMGNPLSCFVSNVFMGAMEYALLQKQKLPRIWLRYVDDIFAVLKPEDINPTLDIINSQYNSIKFTVEIENNNRIPFLDLNLTRTNNRIDINIYRKPTNTNRYITNDSYSTNAHKMAVFNSLIYRMCKLPLSPNNFINELEHIKNIAHINGFYKSDIDNILRKHSHKLEINNLTTLNSTTSDTQLIPFNYIPQITNKLKSIYKKQNLQLVFNNNNKLQNLLHNPKDKIETNNKSGIYKITCNNCDKIYIGQTKRSIITRFKEHRAHIIYNRPSKSAVANHAISNNHNIDIDNLTLIKHITNKNQLDAWESIHIFKNKLILMNDDDAPIVSPLFKFTHTTTSHNIQNKTTNISEPNHTHIQNT